MSSSNAEHSAPSGSERETKRSKFLDHPTGSPSPPAGIAPAESVSNIAAPPARKLKIKKKVYPSVAQFPTVDFRALLETEREKIERDTNAVIVMRGKGSGFGQDDEGKDLLYVLIEAENEEQGHKAERMVRDVLNDPSKLPPPMPTQLAVRQSIFGPRPPHESSRERSQPSQSDFYREVRVPDDVAGGIIGRGGETVKRMQMESNTRIHINREPSSYGNDDGMRVIAIRGPTQESVDLCERLVMDFVHSRQQQQPSSQGPSSRVVASAAPTSAPYASSGTPMYQQQQHQQQQQITEHYSIPNHRAGAVIGRAGSTIKALQTRYNARVNVPTAADAGGDQSLRTVVISADSQQTIDAIKREIDAIVEGKGTTLVGGGPQDVGTPVKIPDDKAGLIIGKQGATIKSIQDRLNVRIQIPSVPDNDGSIPPTRTAMVIGTRPESVLSAIQEIEAICNGELNTAQSYQQQQPQYGGGGYQQQPQQQQAQHGGYQTYGAPASGSNPAAADHAKQWEEYYNQLRLLPPDQQKVALEALAEYQRNLGAGGAPAGGGYRQ